MFLTAAGIDDLAAVTRADLDRFLIELRASLSTASAARTMSAVRGLHRFAAREGLAPDDPGRDVRPPAPPKRLPKALAVDQVERILAVPGDDPLGLRDKALLEFLYGTGARISEAVGLAVDDVDDATVMLHGKGGKTRLVPLGRYARAALDAYLVRSRPGLLPALRAAGHRTYVWTVNAETDLDLVLEHQVDGVITDRPRFVLDHLNGL